MTEITQEEIAAGSAERHFSTKDRRIVALRIWPMTLPTMTALLARGATDNAVRGTLARVTRQNVSLIRRLNEICHAEIFAASCQLASIDLGPVKAQLQSAIAHIARHAPHKA